MERGRAKLLFKSRRSLEKKEKVELTLLYIISFLLLIGLAVEFDIHYMYIALWNIVLITVIYINSFTLLRVSKEEIIYSPRGIYGKSLRIHFVEVTVIEESITSTVFKTYNGRRLEINHRQFGRGSAKAIAALVCIRNKEVKTVQVGEKPLEKERGGYVCRKKYRS